MKSFLSRAKCLPGRAAHTDGLIAEWCARSIRPVSIVNDSGFHTLLKFLEPGYALPCRKTISSILSRKHALGIEELRCILQKADGLATTSDLWTSKATEGYASVTGHFLDAEWRFQTRLLKTCNFPQQHTGRNIADLVLHVASLFRINVDHLPGLRA